MGEFCSSRALGTTVLHGIGTNIRVLLICILHRLKEDKERILPEETEKDQGKDEVGWALDHLTMNLFTALLWLYGLGVLIFFTHDCSNHINVKRYTDAT